MSTLERAHCTIARMESTFHTARFLSSVRRAGCRYGQPVLAVAETSSTNDDALDAARRGAPGGATFVADVQRHGRGRRGRTWFSSPGDSLTFSVVLRPQVIAERLPLVTLATGLALREAILDVAPSVDADAVALKWPNDVLYRDSKIAGVLVEAVFEQQRLGAVVVGVGVNLRRAAFPQDLAHRATSFEHVGCRDVEREALLAAILHRLGPWMDELETGDVTSLVADLRVHDALRGRVVTIDGEVATAHGVDDEGALLAEVNDQMRAVTAGTVELPSWSR